LTSFTSDFDRSRAGFSPDRLDALVWGLHELMLTMVDDVVMPTPIIVSRGASIAAGAPSGPRPPPGYLRQADEPWRPWVGELF
jgi:hypothetical protein